MIVITDLCTLHSATIMSCVSTLLVLQLLWYLWSFLLSWCSESKPDVIVNFENHPRGYFAVSDLDETQTC